MSTPVLLYLVTEDWYFVSHRLPMARAARDAGFAVHVACRVDKHRAPIEAEGFALHPLPWARESRGPGTLLRETAAVRALYRSLKPALVHQVALKPAAIGSIASTGLGIPTVNSVAGLGWGFIARGLRAALVRQGLGAAIRWLFNRRTAVTVVQNEDDRAALRGLGVRPERLDLIPGSGVDTDLLRPLPEPEGPFTIGFAGRLLEDKGIQPLVAAHAILRREGHDAALLVAGTPDPSNPASMDEEDLAAWRKQAGVTLLGHVSDIVGLWARCHVAALPSRREGLPKALLEAAACGRALVATDVPGCRDVARPGVSGLLVPADDAPALADALRTLMLDAAQRRALAQGGRRLTEEVFSAKAIGRQTADLYLRLAKR
ncbi:glycosyltransferase family 4 protein [uncultured Alsobacter sp.]|uniref:glycosyltransferase family 4 protein n=1 Tax=uncultured Alsobacter sp. TaxID=1748258 RepID=UPI0025F1EA7A|nr:glycosyltransferase family 4 protein [uncultured Alsobacter sp.]